jgi:hypothetical protein
MIKIKAALFFYFFLIKALPIWAACPQKKSLPCQEYNDKKNSYSARYKKRSFQYKGILENNYQQLSALEKQTKLWKEIVKSEISPDTNVWDNSFILKGLGGKHGVSNSLHAWVFETDAIRPGYKKKGSPVKLTHTHGVVAKCNFIIKIKRKKAFKKYTGLFNPQNDGLNIPCLIRLSILNMKDFGPGVAIKLLRDKAPSINNHFLYRLEGFRPKETKNFFTHVVRTELPVMDFDGTHIFSKMFAEAKEAALNKLLPRKLSPTVVAAEHLAPKLNQVALKDKSFRKFGGYQSGVYHRPLHINAGYPKLSKTSYPRHLALASLSLLDMLRKDPQEKTLTRKMGVKHFRQHLITYGKALRSSKKPLYKVYVQHQFIKCHDIPKENDKEPFCTEIKNFSFHIKKKGQKQVDEYAEIYLTSDFLASQFGDKFLNFQHTF